MPHPLDVKIASLRRKARLTYLVYGLGASAAIAGAMVTAASAADYWLRYEEFGIRLASTLAVAGVCGWAAWRFVRPAVAAPLDDIYLARQIERRYPMLRERLSGAVAFLRTSDDDSRAGSSRLRQAVIHDTTTDALRLPLSGVLRPRPAVVAGVAALAVVGGIVALAVVWPKEAATAGYRLLMPWGNHAWPPKYRISMTPEKSTTLPSGRRFRVEADLIDLRSNHSVNERITLLYCDRDLPPAELRAAAKAQEMKWENGRQVWTLPHEATGDFWYCAVASDAADTGWAKVTVKEPPLVAELSCTVDYPKYTNWARLTTGPSPAETPLLTSPVPKGSLVTIAGRAGKPVSSVVVRGGATSIAATIDADGQSFHLVWPAEESTSLWFKLIEAPDDREAGGDGPPVLAESDESLQEIQVEADQAPWVRLVEPRSPLDDPQGDIVVTEKALVRLAAEAGDGFAVSPGTAVRELSLRYSRSDRSSDSDQVIAEFQYLGPNIPQTDDEKRKAKVDVAALIRQEDVRRIPLDADRPYEQFDLTPLKLPPGTTLTIYAAASDYQPIERISQSRRLRVASPEQFLEHFNERQRALHAALNKTRADQDRARSLVAEAKRTLDDPQATDEARKQAKDSLREAGNLQRRVATELGVSAQADAAARPEAEREGRGVQGRVTAMLDDLRNNRLDNPEVERRLDDIAGELNAVEQHAKPQEIADNLGEAANADQTDDAQRRESAEALAAAEQGQQRMLDSLEAMLKNLAEWDDYGKFHEDLARIKREQEQLAAETREELERRREAGLGQPADADSARRRAEEQAAKRDELAAKQNALSRRFEQFQQQMRGNNEARGLAGAEAIERALEAAEQANPAGAMREAGQMLRDDQFNKAPERQQAALDRLKQVMQALSAERIDDLNRLVSKLKAAESELAKLAAEQRGLAKKLREAEKIADPAERGRQLQTLSRQQQELQKKAEQMADQLRRLKAESSGAKTARGGDQMGGAGEKAAQGDAAGAAEQAEAAQRDLEDAQRELAEERRQAEADLAQEVAARLEDEIKAALARQQHVVEEIKRFETLRGQSQLTRAAQIGILDLAEEQADLERQARAMAERLASAPAFKLALDGAADEMSRAAARLRERQTDAATLRHAENVVRRYQRLIDAVKPRNGKGQGGNQGEGEQGGGQGGGQSGGDDSRMLSELVLIKLLQEEVNARTKELDDLARSNGGRSADERDELARLSEEQGRLADLLLDMVRESEEAAVPDVELDERDLKLDDPPPARRSATPPGDTE